MKKYLPIFALSLVISACGSDEDTHPHNYVSPEYGPPSNINWNSGGYSQHNLPQGSSGYYNTIPHGNCWGAYQNYSYCGSNWYYHHNNGYYAFPAYGYGGSNVYPVYPSYPTYPTPGLSVGGSIQFHWPWE
jgi:hypothetical protein